MVGEEGDWPQWGGPGRDFRAADPGLATDWSEPPEILWSRTGGEGYSSIVVAGDVLYTMYTLNSRTEPQEVVVALDRSDGCRAKNTCQVKDARRTFRRTSRVKHETPQMADAPGGDGS